MISNTFTKRALMGLGAGAMALGALSTTGCMREANAADNATPSKIEQPVAQNTAPKMQTVSATRKDAYLESEDRIVMLYGDGLWGVEQIVEILNEDGYPAVAYAGGAPGEIEMFVGKGKFGPYTQDDINGGELADDASVFYQERVAAKRRITAELTQD